MQTVSNWTTKIKRFGIKGKMYWYITYDGGVSWGRISKDDALALIDQQQGVILK